MRKEWRVNMCKGCEVEEGLIELDIEGKEELMGLRLEMREVKKYLEREWEEYVEKSRRLKEEGERLEEKGERLSELMEWLGMV